MFGKNAFKLAICRTTTDLRKTAWNKVDMRHPAQTELAKEQRHQPQTGGGNPDEYTQDPTTRPVIETDGKR